MALAKLANCPVSMVGTLVMDIRLRGSFHKNLFGSGGCRLRAREKFIEYSVRRR